MRKTGSCHAENTTRSLEISLLKGKTIYSFAALFFAAPRARSARFANWSLPLKRGRIGTADAPLKAEAILVESASRAPSAPKRSIVEGRWPRSDGRTGNHRAHLKVWENRSLPL